IMIAKHMNSKTFRRCWAAAIEKEDVLTPLEAMWMLEDAYKARVNNITGVTLRNMVRDLCLRNGYEPDDSDVDEAVEFFMGASIS
ncbi:MAG: hypothetical protein V1793_25175, partial [Pseudomonadota bacterium]